MKNGNYIMLDGRKIPLTDEQVKLIQAELTEKSPFDRVEEGETYYYFNHSFDVYDTAEDRLIHDDDNYRCANYCTDKDIMEQHALHVKLNNLLWRYSMTHGGDKIELGVFSTKKYYIAYDASHKEFYTDWNNDVKNVGVIYFGSDNIARAAIEEIVKPFIVEHPDFDVTKM